MLWATVKSWPSRLGGFSNFALSLSIICILAGGVTSFHLGLCSVGGASIRPGVAAGGVLFSLAVAGHVGTALPRPSRRPVDYTTGLAILGGRGWGWATAWFNLAGLITVLAAINVEHYRFAAGRALVPIVAASEALTFLAQGLSGGLIKTFSQAVINHMGIRYHELGLTDFSRLLDTGWSPPS